MFKKRKQQKVLKVKYGEIAKEFPPLHIAKQGDVGLDVAVALPYEENYKEELQKYYSDCSYNQITPSEDVVNEIKHGSITIMPGDRALLPTDIKLEIPKGYWVAVEARSSTSKRSLIVPKGVIDEGYRGEIFAQVINIGQTPAVIHHGDRLVQLILQESETPDLVIETVDKLSKSERGESGFGSSGSSVIGGM